MDGVISDTQKLHSKVDSDTLRKLGIDISPEHITRHYSGVPTSDFFLDILRQYEMEIDIKTLMSERWENIYELAENGIYPIPGSRRLIQSLHAHHYKLAVASSSSHKFIRMVLAHLDLIQYFDALTSGDEAPKGKPSPDIFLITAQKLSVPPSDCLVIEDGLSGMKAASSAGMKCVGLVPKDEARRYPADSVVHSLLDVTVETVENLG